VQVVEARHVLQAEVRTSAAACRRRLGRLVEVEAQRLDDVDFALLQRIDLRLRVAQRQVPFDAVDEDLLAAGGARRRLVARHVLGVLDVHRLVAGLELVLLEGVGARADVLLDLLEGVGLGDALGHDEGHVRRRLAQRLEHEAAGFAQEDAEGVGRGRVHALHELQQREPIASRLPQRCRLAITSSPVTGLPSWNSRPLRSLKVHSRLSPLSVQLSTICGLILAFSSVPNSVS
jgi:hypothetical protein